MLDMRLGNSGDIPFIMNLVRDGITSGAFFYAEGNGLETVRSELQSVTQQYRDNIPVGDYLFVFAEKLTRQPVGFSLLTGRNDFAGRASHLEIRMWGLRSNGTETYDNGINMLYLKCFYLGLTLSGTKTYVKV